MTHYDVDYSNLGWDTKCKRAVADCQEYLGRKAHLLPGTVREFESLDQARFWLSFIGIQGFPVIALAYAYHPEMLET